MFESNPLSKGGGITGDLTHAVYEDHCCNQDILRGNHL